MNMKPKQFVRPVLVNLDEAMWNQLAAIRSQHGRPIAETIRMAIRVYLNDFAEQAEGEAIEPGSDRLEAGIGDSDPSGPVVIDCGTFDGVPEPEPTPVVT